MMGYEDAFLGSLENSFVTQLYPSIYGDDFPDIILQNVFPPPKPVVALAGESKFIYSALDSHITGSLHFRMDYIKRHVPKSAALTDKSSALAYEGSGFKQVPQERVPNLPASREEAEKSYFQGFPAKATSTLRKPQPPSLLRLSIFLQMTVLHCSIARNRNAEVRCLRKTRQQNTGKTELRRLDACPGTFEQY